MNGLFSARVVTCVGGLVYVGYIYGVLSLINFVQQYSFSGVAVVPGGSKGGEGFGAMK